ncbi:MAG: SGNH/GDSL hydrolase family protein [Myxococcales bacterium]|nr:SGNH/GDSL hydrolase family protein [Myxococcales bacterium]
MPETKPRSTSRPRWRALVLKLALASASLGIMLLLIEIGFRLLGYQAIFDTYSKSSLFWQHHPLLGWVHTPNSTGTYVGPRPWPIEFSTEIHINSLGLRGPEIEPLAPGGKRILFTGDSVVAGFEVEYEETFVALLGKQLSEDLGVPVQTINAGVRGYGTDQSYLYYREYGHKLKPDVVVFVASHNDPVDNVTLHRMRRPFGKAAFKLGDGGEIELVGTPVEPYPLCSAYALDARFEITRQDTPRARAVCWLQMNLADHSAFFTFAANVIRQNPRLMQRLYDTGAPDEKKAIHKSLQAGTGSHQRRLTAAIMQSFATRVAATDAGFLVVGHSRALGAVRDDISRPATLRTLEIDPLCEADCPDLHFRRDSHWNAKGHAHAATFLRPRLRELLLPPLLDTRNAPRSH